MGPLVQSGPLDARRRRAWRYSFPSRKIFRLPLSTGKRTGARQCQSWARATIFRRFTGTYPSESGAAEDESPCFRRSLHFCCGESLHQRTAATGAACDYCESCAAPSIETAGTRHRCLRTSTKLKKPRRARQNAKCTRHLLHVSGFNFVVLWESGVR